MGGDLSRARASPPCRSPAPRAIRRRTSPSTRSAARRSWPIPTGRAATISLHGTGRPNGPGGGAHGRAHHLSLGAALQRKFGRDLQNRDALGFRLRRRLPGRELSAPPGRELRRPLRRQLLPLHHPRHGLFRPGRRSMAACWPRPSAARRRASACSPSPPTGSSRPRENRDIVHALNAAAANVSLRRDRDRQGPRRLPARRAGDVPHAARLPAGRRRRRGA